MREQVVDLLTCKELEMFRSLGYSYQLNMPVSVVEFYKMIAEKCFIHDVRGVDVDSLRRCLRAIINCNPYRKTQEFDDLIKV